MRESKLGSGGTMSDIRRLDADVSGAIRASLAFPQLSTIVSTLLQYALQQCQRSASTITRSDHIKLAVKLAPEWEVACQMYQKGCSSDIRSSSTSTSTSRMRDTQPMTPGHLHPTLQALSHLGLLDIIGSQGARLIVQVSQETYQRGKGFTCRR